MKVGLRVSGRRVVSVLAAGVLLATTMACTNDAGQDEPPQAGPTAATASPGPDPLDELTVDEQIAVEESLEAFDNLLEAFMDVAAAGGVDLSFDPHALDHLLEFGDPEASAALDEGLGHGFFLKRIYDGGYVTEGTIEWELLEVIEVEMDFVSSRGNNIPRLFMRLCVDETGLVVVDQETGDVVEDHHQGGRHPATVRAAYNRDDFIEYQQDYAWRIGMRENHLDESC